MRWSILQDGGAAKRVVDAERDQIDGLTDAIEHHRDPGGRNSGDDAQRRHGLVSASHEKMVVFDGDRPTSVEAIFKTAADRAAHPAVLGGGDNGSGWGEDIVVPSAGYRHAALQVKQRVAPGITDLSGEQPKRVDPRAIGYIAWSEQEKCVAHLGAAQAHPIALSLKPEYPRVALGAVAELAAGNAAGGIVATFRADQRAGRRYIIPAVAARAPAAVASPIEARPVPPGRNHRHRSRVWLGRQVGGGRARDARCEEGCRQNQLSHGKVLGTKCLRLENL